MYYYYCAGPLIVKRMARKLYMNTKTIVSMLKLFWIYNAINIFKFRSGDIVLRGTNGTPYRDNGKTKSRWAVNIFCLYIFGLETQHTSFPCILFNLLCIMSLTLYVPFNYLFIHYKHTSIIRYTCFSRKLIQLWNAS